MKTTKYKDCLIWGSGSWGTALALHLSKRFDKVAVWVYEKDVYEILKNERENKIFLPTFKIPENVSFFHKIEDYPFKGDLWVSVTPTQFLRNLWQEIGSFVEERNLIVSASKGIENKTHLLPSQIISSLCKEHPVVVMSGPSFARDFVKGDPTAVVFASKDEKSAKKVQEIFSFDNLRGYLSTDQKGVELGGALKNVLAIAAGISVGLGFGPNAVAAVITRGIKEISRLGKMLGCSEETFSGLSGLGDLVLTCYGDESRNRTFGYRIGRGEKVEEIVKSMKMVAEGVPTTLSLKNLLLEHKVDMPLSYSVYSILYEDEKPKKALEKLLQRSLKWENE
jgi:glycerol-3-phosphate dehydrogenase (NAD(P)+)